MSELLVTQCPYCQTRFRLSQQHLAAAAGNVRCGACLKVFNASLSRTPSSATQPDTAAQPPVEAAPPESPEPPASLPGVIAPRQGTLLIHDDLDFDELDLEALGLDESLIDEVNPKQTSAAPAQPEQEASPPEPEAWSEPEPATCPEPEPGPEPMPEPTSAAVTPPGPESTPGVVDDDQLRADAAQAGADIDLEQAAPLPDMDAEFELELDPEADAASLPDPQQPNDPLLDLHEDFISSPVQDFGPARFSPEPESADDPGASDAPPSFGLPRTGSPLRPLAADPASAQAQGIFLRDRPEYVTPKLAWHEPSEEPLEPEPSEPPARSPVAKLFKTEPEPDPEPEPEIGELDLPEIRDEPVLFEEPPRAPARRRQAWLWGSLSLIAGLALVVQFVAYNFTALAHDQRTRPALATACLLAGCELPPRVDISLLRSSNLMVRSHPEYPNALAVDVILYNRADFAQPFPVLRMSFTDSHGREIASRRFRPEEYLSGELAGARLMPLQTPIHVGLSMLDPGEEAVSYSLDFQSP